LRSALTAIPDQSVCILGFDLFFDEAQYWLVRELSRLFSKPPAGLGDRSHRPICGARGRVRLARRCFTSAPACGVAIADKLYGRRPRLVGARFARNRTDVLGAHLRRTCRCVFWAAALVATIN